MLSLPEFAQKQTPDPAGSETPPNKATIRLEIYAVLTSKKVDHENGHYTGRSKINV